ncbi:MAG: metal-binding protein [Phormidesmis sp. RL_2_1]|nr:metal-binding protein [Phormidesmis sp. RL_2_1]
MPSGRTHDQITLWCLPLVIGITYGLTRSPVITAITTIAYLVGGLMLGPDLDIHSIQYKRWGPIRWIWLPYQIALPHRSRFSHGPLIGTALRVIYLAVWIALLGLISVEILNALWDAQLSSSSLSNTFVYLINHYLTEWFAILIGLEIGAMSHSISDFMSSYFTRKKRRQKKRRH